MTPYLHPRSRLTTSLFGTTLLVSFLVVGMPHIVPCPAPRVRFADSEYEITEDGRRRRRRRPLDHVDGMASEDNAEGTSSLGISEEEQAFMRKESRKCPVPKPGGLFGRVLGFTDDGEKIEMPKPRIELGSRPTKSSRKEEP